MNNLTHIVSIRYFEREDFSSVKALGKNFIHSNHYSFWNWTWTFSPGLLLQMLRTMNDYVYLRECHLSETTFCHFLQNLSGQQFSVLSLTQKMKVQQKNNVHWNPKSFSNHLECQLSQLALFLRTSRVSKTDGTKVCPETCLCTTVTNGEVQMVAFTGLLKDKLTFKGNKWCKMPAR